MRRISLVSFVPFLAGCTQAQTPPAPPAPVAPPAPTAASPPSTAAVVGVGPVRGDAGSEEVDWPMLPIPARAQAAESPPSGWCGETAIQEGLLHLGMWAPQRLINKAGSPLHPDLYSNEIPAALAALGVRFTAYAPRARGYEPFAKWVSSAIDEGHPVLAGVKILPTQHPEWGLDHFVLVVGHGARGLLVNTTWGHRAWVNGDGDATTKGLSFKNAMYALRLDGLVLAPEAKPARITLLAEGDTTMKMSVTCGGFSPATLVRIEQRASLSQPKAVSTVEATADAGGRVAAELEVDSARSARFQCVAAR